MYRHDGFYFRLGLGAGYGRANVDTERGEALARGFGAALELSLGGTLSDGLVIGGGLFAVGMGPVRWEFEESLNDVEEGGSGSIGLLGVLLDYYPSDTDGLHFQGALGIGTMGFEKHEENFPLEELAGGGGGLMLGVGYEWWVGKQWSLGGVARVLVVSAALRGEESDEDFDARGIAPALLFVATHH